jgi:hypothetical protein
MEDTEIVRVAAFKLQESINRLHTLARTAQSPRVRARLLALARQLARYEARLLTLTGVTTGTATSAAEPAMGRTALREGPKRVAAR